jgi:uncharacterized protein (TIGR02301 family)
MRRMSRSIALLMCALALATPLRAQQGRAAPPAPASPAPETPPPYEPDLLKLAEAMGSIAFLRVLCTGTEEPVWRERMASLIESEGRTPARRDTLTATYNRGYRSYALVYRTCTASAEEALVRLAREGESLSRTLAGRFGG